MNEYANVTVSTQCFPADGKGAVSAIRGSASAAGTTTYTPNTVTDTAASWTLTGVLPGDYAFTPGTAGANPMWGIVVSYAPAANNSVLTVDRWRKPGVLGSGALWTPTTAVACTVHSPCHLAGFGPVLLKRINLLSIASAGQTVDITDAAGTALSNFRLTLQTTSLPGMLADFGDGIYFPHPIGFKMSTTTGGIQVVYDSGGYGPR